jgi:hypothetical protein
LRVSSFILLSFVFTPSPLVFLCQNWQKLRETFLCHFHIVCSYKNVVCFGCVVYFMKVCSDWT